ncbi:MAG: hypothetical protein HY561_07790 [Gemmatimonadetes bacterium]|nr:hypothetical protein [Gemmatimonadota bacterium]
MATPAELDRLELAIRRLLEAYRGIDRRARAAEKRVRELEAALRDVASGRLDPLALSQRLEVLNEENRRVRQRLDEARGGVRRLLARLQFLEGER